MALSVQSQLLNEVRAVIDKYIISFSSAWRDPPSINKIFKSFTKCHRRLNAWGFIEGAEYVILDKGGSRTPLRRFAYKHYSMKTRNARKLEERVMTSDDGSIILKR